MERLHILPPVRHFAQNALLAVALSFAIIGTVPSVQIGDYEIVGVGQEAEACPSSLELVCTGTLALTSWYSISRIVSILMWFGWWPAGLPVFATAALVITLLTGLCMATCEMADLR